MVKRGAVIRASDINKVEDAVAGLDKRLTTLELSDLFLTRLHDLAQQKGAHQFHSLDEIAAEFGETDGFRVHQIAKHLRDQGLINAALSSGSSEASIKPSGSLYVERGGETGVISRYRSDPASFVFNITDSSTNFHGGVSNSNIVAHSSHVSQRIASIPRLEGMLMEIVEALRRDASLTKEALDDALTEVEILKLQLGKTEKNEGKIKDSLTTLEKIASVSKTVLEVGKLIFGVSSADTSIPSA